MKDEKKDNLIQYSIRTFQNSNLGDVQANGRKASEAFCKLMIIHSFGEDRGRKIIYSQDIEYNRKFQVSKGQKERKQEFVLSMLIKIIIQKSDMIEKCYKSKYTNEKLEKVTIGYKEYLKRYFDVLIFNGNASSHESNYVLLNQDDVTIVQKILSKLLYWLFTEFLDEPIPDELLPYLAKYDIFLSYRYLNSDWIKILKKNLEQQGYTVFIDNYEMIGGENFKLRLKYAINNSKSAIIVVSEESSMSEWMKKEYEWMKERKLDDSSFRIIPIFIDKFMSPPEEHVHCIDFTKKKYTESFYDLVCSLEGKAPKSKIEMDIQDILVPLEKEIKEDLTLILNHTVVAKLMKSIQSNLPTIIFNEKNLNIENEITYFVEKIKSKFDYVYNLNSPKIEESSYTQKILEEAGLRESDEQQYVKELTIQSSFYKNTILPLTVKSWANILEKKICQEKKNLVIYKLNSEDKFYQKVFSELYLINFSYKNKLKVIIVTDGKVKELKDIYQYINIVKMN